MIAFCGLTQAILGVAAAIDGMNAGNPFGYTIGRRNKPRRVAQCSGTYADVMNPEDLWSFACCAQTALTLDDGDNPW